MKLIGLISGILLIFLAIDLSLPDYRIIPANNVEKSKIRVAEQKCSPVSVRVKKVKRVCFARTLADSSEWEPGNSADVFDQTLHEERVAELSEVFKPLLVTTYFYSSVFPDDILGHYSSYISLHYPPPQLV
jgi:hypothetical protein